MIFTSDEARQKAMRRLPKILFDYLDGGGSSEQTMSRNVNDFRKCCSDNVLRAEGNGADGQSLSVRQHALAA